MALTLRFTFSPACGGGNHFTATATLTPGGAGVFEFSRDELAAPITTEENAIAVRVILKRLAKQIEGQTLAQHKTKIEAKTIDLTVGP